MTSLRTLILCALACAAPALFGACGGCNEDNHGQIPTDAPDQGQDAEQDFTTPDLEESYSCEVDEQALAAQRECIEDEHCPCGAYCDIGLCRTDCREDAECEGSGWCDAFGRCRQQGERGLVPTPASVSHGELGVSVIQITLNAQKRDDVVVLDVFDEAIPRLRVTARDGVRVDCGDGSYVTGCVLENLAANSRIELPVRGDERVGDAAQITLFTERERLTVGVIEAPATPPPALRDDVTGRYQGSAIATAAGLARPGESAPSLTARLEFPLKAEIFDDAGALRLAIDDDLHALSTGRIVGTLEVSGADQLQGVSIPAQTTLESALTPGAEFQALSSYESGGVRVTRSPEVRVVSFDLTQRLSGLVPGDALPQIEWTISLTRVDEPSGSPAPSVPVPDALGYDPESLAAMRLPWEELLHQTGSDVGFSSLTFGDRVVLGQGFRTDREDVPLSLCTDPSEQDVLAIAEALSGQELGLGASVTESMVGVELQATSLKASPVPGVAIMAAALPADAVVVTDGSDPDSVERVFYAATSGVPTPLSGDDASAWIACGGEASYDVERHFYRQRFQVDDIFLTQNEAIQYDVDDAFCARLAMEYDCSIQDVTPFDVALGTPTNYIQSEYQGSPTLQTFTVGPGGIWRVDRVCRLPSMPASCVQGLNCAAPVTAGVNEGSWFAGLYTAPILSKSGEVSCHPEAMLEARQAAIALDRRAEMMIGGARVNELTTTCLDELQVFRETSAPSMQSPGSNASRALLNRDASCIDPVRLTLAMSAGLDDVREQVTHDSPRGQERARVALRLLARWVELHGGLAAEKSSLADYEVIFAESSSVRPDLLVLEQSVRGFDLMLHPRFASAVASLSTPVLAAPDYRQSVTGVDELPNTSHIEGLPIVLYRALTHQLDLATTYQERRLLYQDKESVEALRAVLPRQLIVVAMTNELVSRLDSDDLPAWWPEYQRVEGRLTSATEAATRAATKLELDANPIGIEDSDLPLYFQGDVLGPNGRFSAISDYIVGSPSNPDAWAPFLVERADDAFMSARLAYSSLLDRRYREALADAAYELRIEELKDEFNGQIEVSCGPQTSANIEADRFDAESCYVSDTPECQVDTLARYEGFGDEDWRALLCPQQAVETLFGDAYGFVYDRMKDFARMDCDTYRPEQEACQGDSPCLTCLVGGVAVAEVALNAQNLRYSVPGTALNGVQLGATQADNYNSVTRACAQRHPLARSPRPVNLERSAQTCFHGDIGDAIITLFNAERASKKATQDVANFVDAYNIAVQGCTIFKTSNDAIEKETEAHAKSMKTLRRVKAGLESAAAVAGATKECAATASGTSTPLQSGVAGISCVAGAAEAGLNAAATILGAEIDNAIQDHEARITGLENERDYDICMNNARLELVGVKSAQLDAVQANFDQLRAAQLVISAKLDARGTWSTGRDQLLRLEARRVTPSEGGDWTDEDIARFNRRMRLARRAVYLGVRAVEYEFQTSLSARADVLSAQRPEQLEEVLDDLWAQAGSRGIGGNSPTDFKVVLSLRDDILSLEPAVGQSVADMLELELKRPRYRVFAEDGSTVIGRRIPFELLAPSTMAGDAFTQFSGSDCAERLWSVNASILGRDGRSPLIGSDSTFTRIELRKSDVFSSQWCGAAPEGSALQTASVRPGRNLFAEPGVAELVGNTPNSDPEQTFTRSRIEAYLNVERGEFDADTYANGDTSELAGRGLFGRYELFIPEELVSSGPDDQGLDLSSISDILLRLDYVSVAK